MSNTRANGAGLAAFARSFAESPALEMPVVISYLILTHRSYRSFRAELQPNFRKVVPIVAAVARLPPASATVTRLTIFVRLGQLLLFSSECIRILARCNGRTVRFFDFGCYVGAVWGRLLRARKEITTWPIPCSPPR